jgi:EAL domain-containing protein (putative c-di-GMP-specific phosphodiesterase class I)
VSVSPRQFLDPALNEQLALLRGQQCDEVQGFLVSPPQEPAVLADLPRNGRGRPA